MAAKANLRTCSKGHKYYKSSDCPVCPVCEGMRAPDAAFLAELSAPARRALENVGIITLSQLSDYSQAAILKLHGIGPSSIPTLRKALKAQGLRFKKQ